MSSLHTYKLGIAMACGGCSRAVETVLSKLEEPLDIKSSRVDKDDVIEFNNKKLGTAEVVTSSDYTKLFGPLKDASKPVEYAAEILPDGSVVSLPVS